MKRLRTCIFSTIGFMLIFISIATISGNPIPVYPDPEPTYQGSVSFNSLNLIWIFAVFLFDFFIDILIVYGGILLLNRFDLINNKYIFDFSKLKFFLAVFIIAIIGLISELALGPWIFGFIIALIFIFASFVFVSKYLLNLDWTNGIRLGVFALVINIMFWILIFSF